MPFQKRVKKKKKKKKIAADKYLQTNTVKILHESFFSFKVKHVM